MQVFDLDAAFQQIVSQILGHLLGQCGDQRTLVPVYARLDLPKQVVNLTLDRSHIDFRIQQAGRTDDLLDHAIRKSQLIVTWRGGEVYGLAHALQEFRPFQRTIIHCGGQSEAVLDQRALTGGVTLIHGADLRHGDMRFVNDQQEVIREKVKQCVRRSTGGTTVEMTRIVLDAGTDTHLGEHFQIIGGTHVEALGFQLLALLAQLGQTLVKFLANGFQGPFHAFGTGHIMRGRENVNLVFLIDFVSGQRMERGNAVDLVTKEFDTHRQFLVDRDDFDGVAPHAERTAGEGDVVAFVLHGNKLTQQVITVDLLTHLEEEHTAGIFFRRAQAVDAGYRGHHHAITPGQQVCGGLMTKPFHIVIDIGVFLYIGIRLRDIGFRLVVVVVAHEVADGVVRHKFAEFGAQLRGQRLVGLNDEGRALQFLYQPGGGGGFTSTGGTHQNHVIFTVFDAFRQLGDSLWLVARWLIGRFDDERLVRTLDIESHEALS